jgi:hypothetical protein|tara:strand:+ start:3010 stop:3297 length:288 start_codon:yes stop_codon:yes gene_type:complete
MIKEWKPNAVILDKPVFKSKIKNLELSPEAKESMEKDLVKEYGKLTVFAVGSDVTFCKAGDQVLLTPKTLSYCDTIELENEVKFVSKEADIIGRY